jgi:hypothetical protein
LGVSITQLDDQFFSLMQPFLINCGTAFSGIDIGFTNTHLTPIGKPLFNKDLSKVLQKYSWEYCGAIGMLTYLTGSVWPNIAMLVHQCACFSTNPM